VVQVTVQQLAALVRGQLHGDGTAVIDAARPLAEAGTGHVTFIENERHARHLKHCQAAAVVVADSLAERYLETDPTPPFALIAVPDPLAAFITLARLLHGQDEPPPHGIDPLASIDATARVGPEVSLFPFARVGAGSTIGARCRLHSGVVVGRNCRLGDDVVLHPHVVLYDGTLLGDRVVVHANAVLGSDGFGYRCQEGRHVKVPQFGAVEVGDDVEIGAGTTIDRGTFQATRIGAGTKIDNLVQIGHNCRIGRHNLLISQVGIAGSCSTGDYVILAGQCGLADHVHVGDRAQVGAKAGVARDVAPGERLLGSPARPEGEEKRIYFSLDKLPGVCRDVRRIKHQLGIPDEEGRQAS
jgi:UDP-3-O-[3-hydroxymyristoyl] glucosamine N-acyltransferase